MELKPLEHVAIDAGILLKLRQERYSYIPEVK